VKAENGNWKIENDSGILLAGFSRKTDLTQRTQRKSTEVAEKSTGRSACAT
jgi:hypothetical protein